MITLYKFLNHRMRSIFLICLGFLAFYGLITVHPENFTHLSRSLVSHRYLGVGLSGQTNSLYFWKITFDYRVFFPKPYQDLGMCRQTTLSQHIEMISTLYASMCGKPILCIIGISPTVLESFSLTDICIWVCLGRPLCPKTER